MPVHALISLHRYVGIYYLMFTTFPRKSFCYHVLSLRLFPALFLNTYHFSVGTSGLAYIGLGVGFILASVIGARAGDTIYKKVKVCCASGHRL